MKRIFEYFKLLTFLKKRMTTISETMDLSDMAKNYALYVCKMHNRDAYAGGNYTTDFCEIDLAFMNGYIKALHDNNLEFKNGLVKKRDITHDMPSGAVDEYYKNKSAETKEEAINALVKVMEQYETSKTNINIIVTAFKKELKVL